MSSRVAELLSSWRAADRHWESTPPDASAFRDASIAVVRAWLAYHLAIGDQQPGEIALVADDDRRLVAVSPSVQGSIGYTPDALLAMTIDDLTEPATIDTTPEQFAAFIQEGRQDGVFPIRSADGSIVPMGFQARAHYPIAGFHLSRLWPIRPEIAGASGPSGTEGL